MSCKISGRRVTMPVPLGRKLLPTRLSRTELFPELCEGEKSFTFNKRKLLKDLETNLSADDNNLRKLDGVGANGVEDILELIDNGNKLLHLSSELPFSFET